MVKTFSKKIGLRVAGLTLVAVVALGVLAASAFAVVNGSPDNGKHPYVGKVFREGLTAIRAEILARNPNALPGETSNHCYFCWYVLSKGVLVGMYKSEK